MTQPIFLVGPRACGKTTVGDALAQATGFTCIDTDHWLAAHTGMTVAEIVEKEGWDGFRRRESEALRAVTAASTVIATGGGMVLSEANRQFMREHGVVIYLSAPAHVLASRLAAVPEPGQRPTLTGKTIIDEVAEVLAERETLYRAAAHHVVDAAGERDAIVTRALAALHLAQAS
ncbi:shikimate kinase AroL [Siccibacter turicensis]|uniref:Shikimate kinase 1 n=1 Tax=Siccibacter turicensis TaxID=357233 RepID=A0A2P8VNW9_9ENTR|nr:shikimate kinase AroL [Siccibacter turicensis]MDY0970650.1 shikimate kinase AroL [Siccibacter turicensis]PSN09249.1 shikimate kinase AroL [Siccibacter turicensis]